jgi:hypothetical protein
MFGKLQYPSVIFAELLVQPETAISSVVVVVFVIEFYLIIIRTLARLLIHYQITSITLTCSVSRVDGSRL